ncbi:MAG: bifunctional hydroxymethylpyrimidine kinase/phosphomethylpyrimidine kinase [Candidatus Hydrothermae bacterium]|nr:bifunctional hydroxymethylpyrimidine kinase/phosphomethylpyrimidine kinase [Candidatus Hydrothermae bacterium]
MKRALTIAGSDSGGGAGIQADLKTFTAFKVFGMSVLTSVTAQNTVGVLGIHDLDPDFVYLQMKAVMEDIGTDAAKTGMLSNAGIIEAVARGVRDFGIDVLVVDPVMVAKSGDPLLAPEAVDALKEEILPLALVLTPNIPEAEKLSGIEIRSIGDMEEAARAIGSLGPRAVLVKGGHLRGQEAVDLLYADGEFHRFSSPRFETRNTHGTGCTYSAAIAANLALGKDIVSAVGIAKNYIAGAIKNSFDLGNGHGPLNHFHNLEIGDETEN